MRCRNILTHPEPELPRRVLRVVYAVERREWVPLRGGLQAAKNSPSTLGGHRGTIVQRQIGVGQAKEEQEYLF